MKQIVGDHCQAAVFTTRRTGKTVGVMRNSSGQVAVLVTMGIFVLMAFAGLTVDVGQLMSVKRNMQTAADAAALAAAVAVRRGGAVTGAADAASSENGFKDKSQGGPATVTVNNPYHGNANYVEVIVSQAEPTYFLRVLGYTSIPVSTRAVASSTNGPACVYALDPSASGAVTVAGSSTTTLTCGAIIDSNASSALNANGGATLTATSIGVNGGVSGSGFTPTPVTGVAPAPDPLSYLVAPTVSSASCGANVNVHAGMGKIGCSGNFSKDCLNPGTYCGGIQVSGNLPVIFSPGVYVLDGGGLKITASKANISGSGVMFYDSKDASHTYAAIDLGGSELANLSAPTSGAYTGILFFQDRSVPTGSSGTKITGASGSTFDGAIYFSTTNVEYGGNSSSGGYTIIVADTIKVDGGSTLSNNYSSLSGGSPLKSTALYE